MGGKDGEKVIAGRARYNLPDGDTRHVWVRIMAYNYLSKRWIPLTGIFADEPDNSFKYVVPDDYDMDGDDLKTANIVNITPGKIITTTYQRLFAADAWSAPNKRAIFATTTLNNTQKTKRHN